MAGYRSAQGELSSVLAARREWIETRLRQIELEGQQASLAAKLYFAYGDNTP
jgi:outer membrane protein, heavy metal efflux system